MPDNAEQSAGAACCAIDRTTAVEAYLKTVFALTAGGAPTTTSAIARRLQVTPASASAMMNRLRSAGLVETVGWGQVELTEHGLLHARSVVRRHRLLETFLQQTLGMGWDEVHEQAEALEHGLSEHVEDLIAASLDHPTRDPHGDPIPAKDGPHDEFPGTPLRSVAVGATFRVDRVSDRDRTTLRWLASLDVVPGTVLDVLKATPEDGVVVDVAGNRVVFTSQIVDGMWGEALCESGRS